MNNVSVYEKALLGETLNRLKRLRNQWNKDQWYQPLSETNQGMPSSLCALGGTDVHTFDFIISNSKQIIFTGIMNVVVELLLRYNLGPRFIPITRQNAYAYQVGEDERQIPSMQRHQRKILAFLLDNGGQSHLYVFKEFGIGEYLPNIITDSLKKQLNATSVRYISLVDDDAYSDILNHNDNENDPTRGTGTYSLKQFFEMYFTIDEYDTFRAYLDRLKTEASEYFGLTLVKTLTPNSQHHFKQEVKSALLEFDYQSADEEMRLTSTQRELINDQFFGNAVYEALTGANDYAKSFMTAEWLYHSLFGADNVDLTVITMGYFKAVEQFLYDFLCLHTMDKDRQNRKVYAGKHGLVDMLDTDTLQQFKEQILLSGLTGFFGYRDDDGYLHHRNKDLLRSCISDSTYGLIIDALQGIKEIRNEYFHKDNSYDWNVVNDARNKSIFTFYLMLGSYEISNENRRELGITEAFRHDDFYQLCDYINTVATSSEMILDLSVFYVNGEYGEENALFACADPNVKEYDKYGDPLFSGIYFRKMGPYLPHEISFGPSSQPRIIEQGVLAISRSVPINVDLPNPDKTVFKDGVFFPDIQ